MRVCFKNTKFKLDKLIEKVIVGPVQGMNYNDWKAFKCKTIAIITLQVHERDVVEDLIKFNVKEMNAFRWQSQLRFEINNDPEDNEGGESKSAFARVCDWIQEYKYEYLGNSERLVITPLTDRC